MLGQYLGPDPLIDPENTGEASKFFSIILCVISFVLVIPHLICGTQILFVK